MEWAWALAKSLRAVSPPDSVRRLCEAVQVTPFRAVSGLRRTNGNIDRAAQLVEEDSIDQLQAEKRRQKQNILGLCENGRDYVDLELLSKMRMILEEKDDSLVASLLRLANNDFDQASELYHSVGQDRNDVIERAADLDKQQGVSPVISRKRQRDAHVRVDEMSLAALVSMGVNSSLAEEALKKNNNHVDLALQWLTSPTEATVLTNSNAAASTSVASNPHFDTFGAIDQNQIQNPPIANPHVARSLQEEKVAIELLQRVLGQALQGQDNGDGCSGDSLNDECTSSIF